MIPVQASKVAAQLGGRSVLGHRPSTYESLRRAVARGLPAGSVQATLMILPAGDQEALRANLGAVDNAIKLNPEESERLERIARTIAQARETFAGDERGTISFLTTPNRNFGGDSPIRRALSELGARQVEELLVKIAYGFPT